jgi:hypothetical protein
MIRGITYTSVSHTTKPDKKFIDYGIVRRLNIFPAIQADQGIFTAAIILKT